MMVPAKNTSHKYYFCMCSGPIVVYRNIVVIVELLFDEVINATEM
jgi:hypothetical protein